MAKIGNIKGYLNFFQKNKKQKIAIIVLKKK
jgi:hypothetical protein